MFFLSEFFSAGEGGGNSSLPLPPASRTLRHYLSDYCRELTSAHTSSRTRTGNLWFTRANKILKHALKDLFTKVLFSYNVADEAKKIITFSGLRGYSKGVFRTQSNICDGNFLHKYNIFTKKFQLRYSTVLYMPLDISNFLPSW